MVQPTKYNLFCYKVVLPNAVMVSPTACILAVGSMHSFKQNTQERFEEVRTPKRCSRCELLQCDEHVVQQGISSCRPGTPTLDKCLHAGKMMMLMMTTMSRS